MSHHDSAHLPAPLQQEVKVEPKRPSPGLVISLLLTGIGGFIGGLVTSYGPTYMNVYLTQPILEEEPVEGVALVSSRPLESGPLAPQLEPEAIPEGAEGRLVVHSLGKSYLVLQSDADPAWGRETIRTRSDGEGFMYAKHQSVARDAVPESMAGYAGRELVLYDAQGYACTAQVGELELLEQSAGEYYEDASAQWRDYGGGPLLVAALETLRGTCKNALWGRDASLAAPSLARVSKAGPRLRKQARKAFRQTAAYRKLQREFKAEGGTGQWDQNQDQWTEVSLIKSKEEQLVFIGTQMGGCGEFGANIGMIFRREADQSLTRVDTGEALILGVAGAADMDGDGDLDLIGRGDGFDTSLLHQAETLLHTTHSQVGIYYCRC